MAYLDTTTVKGSAAVDQAINYATSGSSRHFSTAKEAIAAMKADISSTNNANTFLKEFCGINLDNTDTGAITGSDAGGSTTKTATSIVPESGALDTSFKGNQFTLSKCGITFYLSSFSSGGAVTGSINFKDLTPKQQYIWQALKMWWAEGALDLITESYGKNFDFTSSTLLTPRTIYFGFYNTTETTGAKTNFWLDKEDKTSIAISLRVNMNDNQYGKINTSNSNGDSGLDGLYYLDRSIAHELTHAVMGSNINYYGDLLQFIKEGMAELTHGTDDSQERQLYMRSLASKNSSLFDNTFNVNNKGTGDSATYAGGYMFMRWLTKQSADSGTIVDGVINNTVSNTSLTGSTKADNIKNSGSYVTISSGAGNDTITDFLERVFTVKKWYAKQHYERKI